MQFFKDLFLGKKGLAMTFWVWQFVLGVVVFVINSVLAQIYLSSPDLKTSVSALMIGILGSYTLYICLAVINAAKYNRDRGFWGWIATIFSVLAIVTFPFNISNKLKVYEALYEDKQQSTKVQITKSEEYVSTGKQQKIDQAPLDEWINEYNASLPTELGGGYILEKVSKDQLNKSLVFHYKIVLPTDEKIDFFDKNFEASTKDSMKNHCKKVSFIFDYDIATMQYYIADKTGKGRVFTVEKKVCVE